MSSRDQCSHAAELCGAALHQRAPVGPGGSIPAHHPALPRISKGYSLNNIAPGSMAHYWRCGEGHRCLGFAPVPPFEINAEEPGRASSWKSSFLGWNSSECCCYFAWGSSASVCSSCTQQHGAITVQQQLAAPGKEDGQLPPELRTLWEHFKFTIQACKLSRAEVCSLEQSFWISFCCVFREKAKHDANGHGLVKFSCNTKRSQ